MELGLIMKYLAEHEIEKFNQMGYLVKKKLFNDDEILDVLSTPQIGHRTPEISDLISFVALFIERKPCPKPLAISGILSAPKTITRMKIIKAISAPLINNGSIIIIICKYT